MSPTISTPLSARSKSFTTSDTEGHGDQRCGHHRGATRRSPSTIASETRRPQRSALGVAEVGDDAPQLLEEVAVLLLDAEELRHLADDDRQGETDDEALEHRLGDEAGEEAEPEQAGDEREDAGHQGEHAGEGEDVVDAAGRQIGDRRADTPPWPTSGR